MPPSPDQVAAERRARRQVRLLVDLTTACLCQDRELGATEAVRMVDALRNTILGLFPDGPLQKTELAAKQYQELVRATRVASAPPRQVVATEQSTGTAP